MTHTHEIENFSGVLLTTGDWGKQILFSIGIYDPITAIKYAEKKSLVYVLIRGLTSKENRLKTLALINKTMVILSFQVSIVTLEQLLHAD